MYVYLYIYYKKNKKLTMTQPVLKNRIVNFSGFAC